MPRRYFQLARPVDERRCNRPSSPWFRDDDGRCFSAYEIEAVLEGVNGVAEAAVVRRRGHLRAYFTTVNGKSWAGLEARLRAAVRAELEGREHMWPKTYKRLPEIPHDIRSGRIERAKLTANTYLKHENLQVPQAKEAVNGWQFEGISEACPGRGAIIVSHRQAAGSNRAPIRVTLVRESVNSHQRLHPGRWGIFEGYFKGDGGMILTKFKLFRKPVVEVRLSNVDAVLDRL